MMMMMMMMSDSAFSELEFKIFNLILESLSFAIKASTEFIMYMHTDACIIECAFFFANIDETALPVA